MLLLLVGEHGVVVVVRLVLGLPRHLILFLEASAGVREPRGHLCECHFCDDSQHYFLSLGRIRILLVLVQPGLECGRGLSRGVFPPGC